VTSALSTSTTSELRGSANLMVASFIAGVVASDVNIDNIVDNRVTMSNSTIKGSDIYVMTGRNTDGVKNLLESSGNAEILAISLYPSITVPIVDADITETNQINIRGSTVLQSLQDVNLIANKGIGEERASTDGQALSLSFIPYGMSVPDRADDDQRSTRSTSTARALIEAGLNNMAVVRVLPVERQRCGAGR
jgi:hypothetical protein